MKQSKKNTLYLARKKTETEQQEANKCGVVRGYITLVITGAKPTTHSVIIKKSQ